eukprot:UN01506
MVLLVVACISSFAVLLALSIFTGYVVRRKLFCNDNCKNRNVKRKFEDIDCNEIKMTAITLSQYPDHSNQHRKRSQSNPDMFLDSVALAIESISSQKNSPESDAKSKSTSTESVQSPQTVESADSLSR